MRRWIIYGAAAALALLLAPAPRTDVGELLPVELLYVYKEGDALRVETDTGNFGTGETLDEALGELKETAPGVVFLDTVDYVIVTGQTIELLPQLWERLRPAAQVCLGLGADAGAAEFLAAHKPGVTLNDIRSGRCVPPILSRSGERYKLEF